ncbi:MAG: sigma-54-dependent Fis family transcriptional regulator [Treponema sp.]|jgi:transcriptional regulator with PAS, ATPase and Fis domain|nr:sigma-54-dependent Fis family transcriptional regulator [Treponema sp.]
MKLPVVLLYSNSPQVLQFFFENLQICGVSRHLCIDSFSIESLSNYNCCVFDISDDSINNMAFLERLTEKLDICKIETPVIILASSRIFKTVKNMFRNKKAATVLEFPVSPCFLKKCINGCVLEEIEDNPFASCKPTSHFNSIYSENKQNTSKSLDRFSNLIGISETIKEMKKKLVCISNSDETVLLEGESGTGKTFIAHMLHENSPRSNFPFVAINAAAIPETIAESELMGSVHGAYTDAGNRPGYFEQANKGTLFLDEICDLSLVVQAKLLKLSESTTLYRMGSTKPVNYDVRLFCATNANIKENIQRKYFRQDLFYRISVLRLKIPSLRERLEDIPLLAEHFLKEKSKFNNYYLSPDALDKLVSHKWPGNIRELKNCIYRAASLCESEIIRPEFITF